MTLGRGLVTPRRTWLLVVVAAVAVVAIVAMAALPRIVDTPRVQSLIASGAAQALGRRVKFRSVSVAVLPRPAVRLHAFELTEDPSFGGGPFLRLDEADLRLKLRPLLRGHVEFATLVLKQPRIALIQGTHGRWNFASLGALRDTAPAPRASRGGAGGAAVAPLVSRVVISGGLVTYEAQGRGGTPSRYRLEDLELTLATRAGALSFAGSARVVPGAVGVTLTDGTLGLGGARTLAEASVHARVALDARDVRPLVAAVLGPEPEIAGALTGRLDVAGTVGQPRAAGDLELLSPEVSRTIRGCAEPKRRTLSLSTVKANVSWDDGRLLVHPLVAGIAGGGITVKKLAATAAAPAWAELSDVILHAIPLERVLVDFLCQDYAVTGPLDLTGTLGLSPTDPWRTLSGDGRLRVGAGKVVGPRALALLGGVARVGGAVSSLLSLDVPASLFSSPVEFESITGSYQIRQGVVTIRDLLYTSRAMRARLWGDYALPAGPMNLDVVLDHGRGQLQAKVVGPAASPSIRVLPAAVLRQVEPEKVERGLRDLLKRFR